MTSGNTLCAVEYDRDVSETLYDVDGTCLGAIGNRPYERGTVRCDAGTRRGVNGNFRGGIIGSRRPNELMSFPVVLYKAVSPQTVDATT